MKEKNIYKHSIIDHAQFVLIKFFEINDLIRFVVHQQDVDFRFVLYLHDISIEIIAHLQFHNRIVMNDNVLVRVDKNLRSMQYVLQKKKNKPKERQLTSKTIAKIITIGFVKFFTKLSNSFLCVD